MKAGTDKKILYFLLKLFPFLVSDSAYKIRMELNWIENPSQRVSEKKTNYDFLHRKCNPHGE